MWRITTRGFTLQEVLILAAMNIAAPALIGAAKREQRASQNNKETRYGSKTLD